MRRIGNIIRLSLLLILALLLCQPFGIETDSGDFQPDMAVHFLDVDQGDSIFTELPNGETMLIDSGSAFYGKSILGYVRRLGFNKIDYFVCTHPHADHAGSAAYIIRNFSIGEIYMPKAGTTTDLYEDVLNAAIEKNLRIKIAEAGVNIVSADGLSVDIVAPVTIDESNLNNCSAVVTIYYRDSGFLFTGDAEFDELESIQDRIRADVLKVGHHGSVKSTHTEFLERVRPKISVISCGMENDYGHPAREVLNMLTQIGSKVYRTDLDKTIVVRTDGYYLEAETGALSMVKEK